MDRREGISFNIETEAHAEVARRIMEYDRGGRRAGAADVSPLIIVAAGRAADARTDGRSRARRLEGARHGNAKALLSPPMMRIIRTSISSPRTSIRRPATVTTWPRASASFRHGRSILSAARRRDLDRREAASELRNAMTERDAGGVLEALSNSARPSPEKISRSHLRRRSKASWHGRSSPLISFASAISRFFPGEGRALLGQSLEHAAGVALGDRIAQFVRGVRAGSR